MIPVSTESPKTESHLRPGADRASRRVGIRKPSTAEDWQKIRETCCRAANDGKGIATERESFFSELWVGPYEEIIPEWTYLAEVDGVYAGYLTGCPDTRAFLRRKRWWELRLLIRILLREFDSNQDTRGFVRRLLGREQSPERRFPQALRRDLESRYPAHLHVNLEAGFRGLGVGYRLIEAYLADLKAFRVPGVHLHCGARPLGFYQRAGFNLLGRVEFRSNLFVHAMAQALDPPAS